MSAWAHSYILVLFRSVYLCKIINLLSIVSMTLKFLIIDLLTTSTSITLNYKHFFKQLEQQLHEEGTTTPHKTWALLPLLGARRSTRGTKPPQNPNPWHASHPLGINLTIDRYRKRQQDLEKRSEIEEIIGVIAHLQGSKPRCGVRQC